MKVDIFCYYIKIQTSLDLSNIYFECLLLNIRKIQIIGFINKKINWLSAKNTYKYIEKIISLSEEDKSQDSASKNSITKKRRQSKRAKIEDVDTKIEYEIFRRKLIQKLKENRESFYLSGSKDEERIN